MVSRRLRRGFFPLHSQDGGEERDRPFSPGFVQLIAGPATGLDDGCRARRDSNAACAPDATGAPAGTMRAVGWPRLVSIGRCPSRRWRGIAERLQSEPNDSVSSMATHPHARIITSTMKARLARRGGCSAGPGSARSLVPPKAAASIQRVGHPVHLRHAAEETSRGISRRINAFEPDSCGLHMHNDLRQRAAGVRIVVPSLFVCAFLARCVTQLRVTE